MHHKALADGLQIGSCCSASIRTAWKRSSKQPLISLKCANSTHYEQHTVPFKVKCCTLTNVKKGNILSQLRETLLLHGEKAAVAVVMVTVF